jgi:hypothetical protein
LSSIRRCITGAIVVGVAPFVVACGSDTKSDKKNPPSKPTSPLVTARAVKPGQFNAPGVRFRTGDFQVETGRQRVTITAKDWNTIVASSRVRRDVRVVLPPEWQHNATTKARFQYLGDRIALQAPVRFDVYDIVGSPKGRRISMPGPS